MLVTLLAFLSICESTQAAGPDQLGPGIRSRVLGGPFAEPADWTSVYWNPAGLMFLKDGGFGLNLDQHWTRRRASSSLENTYYPDLRAGDFQKVYPVEPDGFRKNQISDSALSFTFGVRYNAKYFSLGALNMPAVNMETRFTDRVPTSTADIVMGEHDAMTYVSSIPVAASIPLGRETAVGAAVHLRFGVHELYQLKMFAPTNAASPYAAYYTERDELGVGYAASLDVGFIHKFSNSFSIGGVVRSPYKMRFSGTAKWKSSITGADEESDILTRMYYPLQVDFGLSCGLGNASTLQFGLRHTSWNTLRFTANYRENTATFVDYRHDMKMRQTLEANIGTTVELNDYVTFFAGARYEPSPYGSHHASLFTEYYPNGLSLGAGIEVEVDKVRLQFGVIDRQYDRRRHGGQVFGQDDTEIGVLLEIAF
jgi:long-subunit fatty acid transport protein